MTIQEILKLPLTALKPYGNQLADKHWEIFHSRVCLTCSGDIARMIYNLKKHYNMTKFELTKPSVIYRLQKGHSETISNDNMTDELAIRFLRLGDNRIELFSRFPENWEELIVVEAPREDDEDTSKAINDALSGFDVDAEDCGCDGTTPQDQEPDCKECLVNKLTPMKVKDIQALYPDVPYKGGTSKVNYIEQIADFLKLV